MVKMSDKFVGLINQHLIEELTVQANQVSLFHEFAVPSSFNLMSLMNHVSQYTRTQRREM